VRRCSLVCDFCEAEAPEGELGWVEYECWIRDQGRPGDSDCVVKTVCPPCRDGVDPDERGFVRRLLRRRRR
jgi:hypothetical protein